MGALTSNVLVEPTTTNTNVAIWSRVIRSETGDLPADVARFFLQLTFDPSDLARMHELAEKNQSGELATEEVSELRNYRQVGLQLDFLRAKARRSLAKNDGAS